MNQRRIYHAAIFYDVFMDSDRILLQMDLLAFPDFGNCPGAAERVNSIDFNEKNQYRYDGQ